MVAVIHSPPEGNPSLCMGLSPFSPFSPFLGKTGAHSLPIFPIPPIRGMGKWEWGRFASLGMGSQCPNCPSWRVEKTAGRVQS